MKYFIIVCAIMGLASGAYAQQSPPANVCKTVPQFQQFDFWLGTWDVKDHNGNKAGTNIIRKSEDGCLITESWTNVAGGKGFSINYFDPVTKLWRQVWVSGPGYSIDYAGGLDQNGAMVLTGTIHTYATKTSAPFRGTWTKQDDGTVRQLFEQFDSENNTWAIWFDGTYTKIDD